MNHTTKHCADDYPERDEYGRAFRWEADYSRMVHERVYAPDAEDEASDD